MKAFFKRAKYVVGAFLMTVSALTVGVFTPTVHRFSAWAENTVTPLDLTRIEDDLKDFDVSKYTSEEYEKHSLMIFTEYCYSEHALFDDVYSLYCYVYNVSGREIQSTGNAINLATAYNVEGEPMKYENVDLTLLDSTDDWNYVKFKVDTPSNFLKTQRALQETYEHRRYDVGSIDCSFAEGKESALVGRTYEYTGYSAGCAENVNLSSNLSNTWKVLKTVDFEVFPTYYYAEGAADDTGTTRDTLHSVYFSVPNEYVDAYGAITGFAAEFLDARLNESLVTGNSWAYEYFNGEQDWRNPVEQPYGDNALAGYFGGFYRFPKELVPLGVFVCDYDLYTNQSMLPNARIDYGEDDAKQVTLDLVFSTHSDEEDSADTYSVPFAELIERIRSVSASRSNEEQIQGANGSYLKALFSYVGEKQQYEYKANDECDLTSVKFDSTFLEKLFGVSHIGSVTQSEKIKVIQAVSPDDLTGTIEEDCKSLYIGKGEYEHFSSLVKDSANKDETVYILRYRESKSLVQEATLIQNQSVGCKIVDTNAYFFAMDVALDFRVISVKFTDKGSDTILSIVSDPKDMFPSTPEGPEDPTPDNPGLEDLFPGLGDDSSGNGDKGGSGCADVQNTLDTVLSIIYALIGLILLIFFVRLIVWIVSLIKKE